MASGWVLWAWSQACVLVEVCRFAQECYSVSRSKSEMPWSGYYSWPECCRGEGQPLVVVMIQAEV